jgi:hypothetical protein
MERGRGGDVISEADEDHDERSLTDYRQLNLHSDAK